MRLALLTHEPFYPPSGGGSAEAGYLAAEFVRRGHSVDVFGPELTLPREDPLGDAAEVEKRFQVRLHSFPHWPMGRYTSLRTLKYLAYPLALERWVLSAPAAASYDLFFSQHAISAVAAGRLRQRLQRPVVMNFLDCLTGFMETWPRHLMPRSVAAALVRFELSIPRRYQADAVLTVSDALRTRFLAAGTDPARVHPIYYGYDAARFRRSPQDPIAREDRPVLVMHGSFDRHHLGPIAERALIEVARARPETTFRFVGRETEVLTHFIGRLHAAVPSARIETTGFVPYTEIPRKLADATVGITPYELSTGTHCAFVAKTVEYLAIGIPVVSTPLESATSYYRGLEGIRFSNAQGTDFAARILEWLATGPEARAQAVAPATRKVVAELDWKSICSRAVDVAEQTARSSPTHGHVRT